MIMLASRADSVDVGFEHYLKSSTASDYRNDRYYLVIRGSRQPRGATRDRNGGWLRRRNTDYERNATCFAESFIVHYAPFAATNT